MKHFKRMEKIGPATLYLADCYELAPTLGFFDALVTDPPYAFETTGGGRFRQSRRNMDDIAAAGLNTGFKFRILNPFLCKSVFVFCHNDQIPELTSYIKGVFQRFALCCYHKTNPMPVANKHYKPDTEFYIHGWNKGAHPVGELAYKGRYITTLNGKSAYDHPTVKPLAVMDKIMRNVNGQSVLDPFMGTGTTGVSALTAGKSFSGIEVNEKYFDIACARIAEVVTTEGKISGYE